MTTALVRPLSAVVWELRGAWATGKRLSVTLDRDDPRRLEGWVSRVAASGAFVVLAGRHVPLEVVLAVHYPSRLGDSTVRDGAWHGPARAPQHPGQLELSLVG